MNFITYDYDPLDLYSVKVPVDKSFYKDSDTGTKPGPVKFRMSEEYNLGYRKVTQLSTGYVKWLRVIDCNQAKITGTEHYDQEQIALLFYDADPAFVPG